MTVFVKATIVVAAGALLLGCDRSEYETAPVALKHRAGTVTCQLYTVDRVMWDHALTFPDELTKEEADAICTAEGERRLVEYKASLKRKKDKSA